MHSPRVSIGVPVYNGQKYIDATLDSLIAQTCSDLEIIVTDNCSTDATPQIVQSYAGRDPRVIYLRNVANLGPARNYNSSLAVARGEYFKWCSADDVCAPDFVEKCVAVLDADPAVVLAYPRTSIIDSAGTIVGQYQYELDFDDPDAWLRYSRIINVNHHAHGAHELYGVMRLDALRGCCCAAVFVALRSTSSSIAIIPTARAAISPGSGCARAAACRAISAADRCPPRSGGTRRCAERSCFRSGACWESTPVPRTRRRCQ
jgi:glycosyltransferase involved in cell wall biosynthesis